MDNIICPQVNSDDSSQVALRWSQIKDVCVKYKNNYIYIENSKAISYTCQLFLSCRRDTFYPGSASISKTTQMQLQIPRLNYRIQGVLITSYWITIVPIVSRFALQKVLTPVKQVVQSGPAFCSCSDS